METGRSRTHITLVSCQLCHLGLMKKGRSPDSDSSRHPCHPGTTEEGRSVNLHSSPQHCLTRASNTKFNMHNVLHCKTLIIKVPGWPKVTLTTYKVVPLVRHYIYYCDIANGLTLKLSSCYFIKLFRNSAHKMWGMTWRMVMVKIWGRQDECLSIAT